MKNLKYLLVGLIAFTLPSCSDDDPDIIVNRDEVMTVAPVLTAPTPADYVVVETVDDVTGNETTQAGTFTWSAADSDYNGQIQYYVQMAPAGSNFVDSVRLFTAGVTDLTKSFTFGDINTAMNRLNTLLVANGAEGIKWGASNKIDVRIAAVSAASESTIYSAPVTINVTPYEVVEAVVPVLYFVGAPQAYYGVGAWAPEKGLPMRYIGNGTTKVFEAYVKIAAGEGFKFTGSLGWDNGNYGTIGGAQNGSLEDSSGSSDIKVADTDGFYYIQADIDNLTYKAVKMNWGIIGSSTAGGWDNETPMTYDFSANKFTISTTLTADKLKFRSANTGMFIYNDAWKFNVGDSNPKVTYNPAAPDFSVTAGTHALELSIDLQGTATVSGL